MKITPLAIPALQLVEPRVFSDARGWFMETWEARKFAEAGIDAQFVQDNHSCSQRGTLRGLHYQIRQPQGKLVRVAAGEIYDVAVDLRRHSATFGQWLGVTLSASNKCALWIPPGFAHGFYVTSDNAEVIYKCTDFYAPAHERCLRWDDSTVGIAWPLIHDAPLLLSDKDQQGKAWQEADFYA